MPTEIDPQLEGFIHEHLRQLPPLTAPSTLLPRVLAAIRAQPAEPWWSRAWWEWPAAARAALVLLALAALAVVSGGNWFVGDGLDVYGPMISERVKAWSGLWGGLTTLAQTPGLLWTKFVEPAIVPALVFSLLLYLLGMGCGTALVRLAGKRA